MSEERRLFYVGLTRSKNNVYLISDKITLQNSLKS
ncbi:MAG: 3'-5' exonuclease [Methanobrevibacter smithii]